MHDEKRIQWPKNVWAKKRHSRLYKQVYRKTFWQALRSHDTVLIGIVVMGICVLAGTPCFIALIGHIFALDLFGILCMLVSVAVLAVVAVYQYVRNVRHQLAYSKCTADKKGCRAAENARRQKQGLPPLPPQEEDEEEEAPDPVDPFCGYKSDI